MKQIVSGIKWPLLGWLLVLFQSPFFFLIAWAQTSQPEFKSLFIELWPEYDQPSVLVIYRAELEPDVALPARLTFRLPDYVEKMHAVAYEQNGLLLAVAPETITLRPGSDASLLTFSTPSPKVQIEYYDPVILTKQDQQRYLDYSFSADYETETATIQLQQPVQARGFSLIPKPNRTFTDNNGLSYHVREVTGLTPGKVVTLTAAYQRDTNEVSTRFLEPVSEHAPDMAIEPETAGGGDIILAYILAGAGFILCVGAMGHWWYSRRKARMASQRRPGPQSGHRRRPAGGRSKAQKAMSPAMAESSAGFCYRCGTALRPESNFCHHCGAERRRA